jgi:bisphosphoglycerate-dependent phosphoglycerate mutase
LVVAHGTSLRGVVKYLKDLDEASVSKVKATPRQRPADLDDR